MRVVAGRHRGRTLFVPAGRAIRPTGDRAREALFNILAHGGFGAGGTSIVAGAVVLDAFCGTGALGLEALSRGAARAIFIDNDRAALAATQRNVATLGLEALSTLIAADAADPPPRPGALPAATLAFLDPPYGEGLAATSLAALAAQGWLAPAALCCVEHEAKAMSFRPPEGFTLLDERRYGKAAIALLRFAAA
jgi:16S rRNA (guanine966-N2)-methyltransferase